MNESVDCQLSSTLDLNEIRERGRFEKCRFGVLGEFADGTTIPRESLSLFSARRFDKLRSFSF